MRPVLFGVALLGAIEGGGFSDPRDAVLTRGQAVRVGGTPCEVLGAASTSERLVCETGPAAAGPPLPICVFTPSAGPEDTASDEQCLPGCQGCSFQYMEEETPYVQWLSRRALQGGDVLAFGAFAAGAFRGASALDSVLIAVDGVTCDTDARQGLVPGFVTFKFTVLPWQLDDTACEGFPCFPGQDEPEVQLASGYGRAAFRTYLGGEEARPVFLDAATMAFYDIVVHPEMYSVVPRLSGLLGGAKMTLRGSGFSSSASRNSVSLGGVACEVTEAGAAQLECVAGAAVGSSGCVELDVYAGAQPQATELELWRNATRLQLRQCRASLAGGDRKFVVEVGDVEANFHWADDRCPGASDAVRGTFGNETDLHTAMCCAVDGRSCSSGKPRIGLNPIAPVTWEETAQACQALGMRLCSKAELVAGACCRAAAAAAERLVWAAEGAPVQRLSIRALDQQPWSQDLWLRCEELCPDSAFPAAPPPRAEVNGTGQAAAAADANASSDFNSSGLLQGPFPGGRGLRVAVYQNPGGLPLELALSSASAQYPQSPSRVAILADLAGSAFQHVTYVRPGEEAYSTVASELVAEQPASDDTGADNYAEEAVGFFVAPFTAEYSFYLAADAAADLALSPSGATELQVIARAARPSETQTPRFSPLAWYSGPCVSELVPQEFGPNCSISTPQPMKAGGLAYLRLRHTAGIGSDWLRLGLRIHAPVAADGQELPMAVRRRASFTELQKVSLSVNVIRERHRIELSGLSYAFFNLQVTSAGRVATAQHLGMDITAAQLQQRLWGLGILQCMPEVSQGADLRKAMIWYMVTFPCPKKVDGGLHASFGVSLDGFFISISGLAWSARAALEQLASERLSGSFRLAYRGAWTAGIGCSSWQDIPAALAALHKLGGVELWPVSAIGQDSAEGWAVALSFAGEPGDIPMLETDASGLAGPGTELNVSGIVDGSLDDLFLEAIPADWLRTAHEEPQVVVSSNGVVALTPPETSSAVRFYRSLSEEAGPHRASLARPGRGRRGWR